MKSTIAETRIARVTTQQIDIGQISAGPLAIGTLALDSVHVGLSTGTASLRNLRLTISLRLELDWDVGVDIDFVGHFGWNGSIDLGTHAITVPLGNVIVPGLQNMSLDIASARVTDVSAVIGAIRNLRLGGLVAEQVRARGLTVPVPDFHLTGLGIGGASIRDLAVPGATAAETTVGHVHGAALPLGTVTIPGLSLPSAAVGNITSNSFDASGTSNPLVLTADAGVLSISLRVTPGGGMHADEMRLSSVRATTSIGSIAMQNVVLPYDVLNIKLSQLGIETIEIPQIEVS